ncbi:MAG: O-antigen ligase family protein [Clostridia bacterium]|nr:O-antigen ligase family protein [Clostridia bacterium]MBQ7095793.1 O-antigen ligase family protein [Clostridia bacterium]
MNVNIKSILRSAENVAYIALCVAIANGVFFGTANYAVELGFSVWSIVIPVMVIGSLALLICNIKDILKNSTLWLLIAYGVWILISAVRGYQAGNDIGHITEDLQRVIYFSLFPLILTILNRESRIIKLMKIVVYGSLALSILTIIFYISYLFLPALFDKLLYLGYYGQMINFTRISDVICRILFVSTPMQLFGCAFALYFLATDRQHTIRYSIIIGLNLFCILMSFTRTLYLATFVAAALAILLVFLKADQKSRLFVAKGIATSVVTCAVIIVCFSTAAKTNYFGYALQRVFVTQQETPDTNINNEQGETPDSIINNEQQETPGSNINNEQQETPGTNPSTNETPEIPENTTPPEEIIGFENEDEYLQATLLSDNIRENTKKLLQARIDTNPLCGVGLGMRLPERETPPEFFYLDLWAKTGLLGLLLFLIPACVVIIDILKRIIRRQPFLLSAVWAVGLIGLMVYSVLQPYMNTAPCVLMYCCVLCVNAWQKKHAAEQNEIGYQA